MDLAIGGIDFTVLALYMAVVVAVGFWVGRGQRDLQSYLLGGRNVPWWVILGSLVATETSTATFLSVPGIAYAQNHGDLRFLQLTFGYILGRWLIAVVLLPWFFRGKLYTAYEVLHKRFGGATKTTASAIFLVTRNLSDGLRLYLTAIALREVVGFSLPACITMIGVATIVYTVFGGMKSVVWNDCVQFIVYVTGGAVALVMIGQRLPGGWNELIAYGLEHDKFQLFDFHWELADPYTFWAGLFGGMFLTLGTHGTDQMMVQRYLCARNVRDAGRALVASGFVVFVQFALFLLLGVALASYYARFPPAVPFEKPDYVFATFIVREVTPDVGLIGLLLAAVFAAAMSTLSSSLNSSASAFVADFYLPSRRVKPSEKHLVYTSRLATIAFGIVQIGVGIAADHFSGSVVADALAIASFAAGLLLGIFLLGVLTERVGQAAGLVGMIAGLAAVFSAKFVAPGFDIEIGWPWFALIGAVVTFSVGCAASVVLPRQSETSEELSDR